MAFFRKTLRVLLKTLLTALIVLSLLLVFVLAGGLGPTVKYVGAPIAKAFGLHVSVGRCVILPLGGYVRVEGLRVENPTRFAEGKPALYRDTPLLALGTLELDVGMRSLLSKEYVVDTVRVEGLRALYAYDLDTTNVDALMEQMGLTGEGEAAPAPEPAQEEPAAEPAGAPKDIRFRVGCLHFEDNVVTVRKYVSVPIPLPPLTLRDVDNATLSERVGALLTPIQTAIQGLGKGLGAATDLLGDGASAVGSALGSGAALTGEGLSKGAESLKGVGESAKEALGGLKGLLRKSED